MKYMMPMITNTPDKRRKVENSLYELKNIATAIPATIKSTPPQKGFLHAMSVMRRIKSEGRRCMAKFKTNFSNGPFSSRTSSANKLKKIT